VVDPTKPPHPLGPLLDLLPLYAGVTVSGAGKAQLLLDLGALAKAATAPGRAATVLRRGQPRVLLVDDSRIGRENAARILSAAGYQTIGVEDGWEAWELLGERRFDAVVTDLEMPRMDGYELIARIRSEPTLRGLPVLVYSARNSSAARDRALAAGASTVLPKAPGKRGLPEALRALLGDAALTAWA
jgi:CheY-like chemotaxis protein